MHEQPQSPEQDALMVALCRGTALYWRDRGKTREALHYLPWGITAGRRIAAASSDGVDRRRLAYLELD